MRLEPVEPEAGRKPAAVLAQAGEELPRGRGPADLEGALARRGVLAPVPLLGVEGPAARGREPDGEAVAPSRAPHRASLDTRLAYVYPSRARRFPQRRTAARPGPRRDRLLDRAGRTCRPPDPRRPRGGGRRRGWGGARPWPGPPPPGPSPRPTSPAPPGPAAPGLSPAPTLAAPAPPPSAPGRRGRPPRRPRRRAAPRPATTRSRTGARSYRARLANRWNTSSPVVVVVVVSIVSESERSP